MSAGRRDADPGARARSRPAILSWIVLGGVLLWAGLLAAVRISDPDTMQYLAGGRYIVAHGLEHGCVYSYAGEDCQIVYPQWLFQVLSYLAYFIGGYGTLVALQIALVVAVFGTIVREEHRRGTYFLVTAYVVVLTALVARERFQFRADFFAILPAVWLYYALDRLKAAADRRTARRLWVAIACIQAAWANLHGSFPIGFLIAAAFLVESGLDSMRAGNKARRTGAPLAGALVKRVAAAFGIVIVASFLNPYGPKAFFQPIQFLLQGSAMSPQLEFLSPFAPADLERTPVMAYKLMLVLLAVVVLSSLRRLRATDVLILAPLTYLSATGVRYVALFAVFCAVLTPRLVDELRAGAALRWASLRSGRAPVFVAVVAAVLLLGFVAGTAIGVSTNALYRYDSVTRRTGFGISDLVFPIAAADFVERNAPAGNMLNDYSVGTYLNWRLFPARKTFVDGHTYSAARLAEYLKFIGGGTSYQSIAAKYDVGFFFLSHKSAETRALIRNLLRDSQWALVYFDEMAMIFARNRPENAEIIGRYRIEPKALAALPRELANIRHPDDTYLGHTDRGLILSTLGFAQAATSELETAVAANPRSFVALTALGNQRSQAGRLDEGVVACETAVALRSRYAPARACLGVLYLQQKRTKEAIASLERAVALNAKAAIVHFNLGIAYENDGERRRALEQYRKELALNPAFKPAQEAMRRLGSRGPLD